MPFPYTEDLPDPGIELESPALQANFLPSEPLEKPAMCSLELDKNVSGAQRRISI